MIKDREERPNSIRISGSGKEDDPYTPVSTGDTTGFLINLAENCIATENIQLGDLIFIKTFWGTIYVQRESEEHPNLFVAAPGEGEICKFLKKETQKDIKFGIGGLISSATKAAAAFTQAELAHKIQQALPTK